MKLLATILLLAAVTHASSQTPFSIEAASPQPWLTPLDLSLGHPTPLTADRVYGSVFSIRCEIQRIPSVRGEEYVVYRWFARNIMDRTISIAVVGPMPQSINPRGLGRVYGATWADTTVRDPLNTEALYGVRIMQAAGWKKADGRPQNDRNYLKWLPLPAQQEREIHSELVSASTPVDAALFTIPFQIEGFPGDAFLCSATP